jgi:monovalent cation:H+ antiporter-2, CPA2 family
MSPVDVQHALPYLREVVLFLALAGILIPLLERWRVNQVLGFLAAGVLVGPFGLGLWTAEAPWLALLSFQRLEVVASLAELGVLFLMFMIGLELSAERLWALRRWVFGAGTAQVAISAVAIGAVAYGFGHRIELAVVLGLVLALSSTAFVMQLLTEGRTLGTPLGQAAFSVLMLQDLAVVPLLILVGVLAGGSEASLPTVLGLTAVKSVVAIVVIYLLGRRVIRPLFRTFASHRKPDAFMALTLLATLAIAGLTAIAGLSMALGAFLAGLLLAETEYRHEVEVTIEPFKGLLMGLFFMSVGMGIDLRQLAAAPVGVPLSVVGLFAIKAAVTAPILRIGGLTWGRALEGGLLLGQGGEFAFIIVGYALLTGLFEPAVGQFLLIVVGLTLFVTPLAARLGQALGDRIDSPPAVTAVPTLPAGREPPQRHVIIAGYGRVGQVLGQLLEGQGVDYVALESDPRVVSDFHGHGQPVFFGDASRGELLRRMNADRAAAVVLTMDNPASALHAVRVIRSQYPDLPIYARSRDERHALALRRAGATLVVPETLESSLQLSAVVLSGLGIADTVVGRVVQAERDRRILAMSDENAAPAFVPAAVRNAPQSTPIR